MTDVLLGVDIGTSSSRGVITHPDGDVVATAERQHGTDHPAPGFVEQDPEQVWWADVTAIVAELLAQADGPVRGSSVSGIGATTLPADADGDPLRPAILYGVDTRAGEEIAELLDRYGQDQIVERSLSRLSHQSIGPKLLWLRRHEPDVWDRTRQLLMANSFVVGRLTGEYTLDTISASFCSPMFDPRDRRWIDDVADEMTSWLRAIADDRPFEDLLDEAARTPAGAAGLVALPYFAGERSPVWDPHARGVIAGLTVRHTRGHLYRALLEATAFSARAIVEALRDDGVGIKRVVAVGSGTRGALWTQIVSDITGLTQQLSEQTMGACYGDALFAARAAGLVDTRQVWARTVDTVEPDAGRRNRYDRLYDLYQRLYPATAELAHELAWLQDEEGFAPEGGDTPHA